ncbi:MULTISPECIES: hypothetical protein [unclassified Streptomyces]|uniref:hypothetical protein n=1 Tax=unclassified Streptomyces TaxID=2593676 RepID=UPI0003735A84|nr:MULTISPECIES: hypothetical protein [unclassified Streptomyces]MYR67580.1 hypothetical protein [Streptomyces sp. SID4939]MYR99108.1 hypothetical protein [Streptomyces sp. SID4940]MYT63435.1 hypothetical protein [Streptomyces sp. SID8357]MYT85685.1 hypothetical protein [Streptomyces sp. SID8360]MYW38764.1 hypothetical protein [Streptomyces sp. SID1]
MPVEWAFTGPYGEEGSHRSVADVTGPAPLAEVRAHKHAEVRAHRRRVKAAAKAPRRAI